MREVKRGLSAYMDHYMALSSMEEAKVLLTCLDLFLGFRHTWNQKAFVKHGSCTELLTNMEAAYVLSF
jgi:hypothetical protein